MKCAAISFSGGLPDTEIRPLSPASPVWQVNLRWWLSSKESACNAGDAGDMGFIAGSERSSGEGNDNPVFLPEKSHGQRTWWLPPTGSQRAGHSWAAQLSDTWGAFPLDGSIERIFHSGSKESPVFGEIQVQWQFSWWESVQFPSDLYCFLCNTGTKVIQ